MHCQPNGMMARSAHLRQRELAVQFLGLIVPILIMCVVWYSRFYLIVEMLNDIEAGIRSWLANRSQKKPAAIVVQTGLSTVNDPASAAAVLLYSLANEADVENPAHKDIVARLVAEIVPPDRLSESLTFAQGVARHVTDARDVVRRFKSVWRTTLDVNERHQLIAMAEAVATTAGPPNQIQQLCLASLRDALAGEEHS
jgi:hypothetical protein